MTEHIFFLTLEVAVICCGLVSGFFLTFSDFLMRSLYLAKVEAGIEVMQIINREVWRSIYIFLLWGMAPFAIVLAGYAYWNITGPAMIWVMIGSALYVFGVLVISYGFNIPMNNRLDAMEYSGTEAATYWKDTYVSRWVLWNYIRAITTGGAAICFLVACILIAQLQ
ncbi:anthrone oxygenase family protein [Acaryochloris marina]|uniref:DUF1772 domain-containing protein n=1 Tax=Acaryochloris marina (strain MBIC 11017) TaxID=329726 RepID=B0C3V4_ACAM1|nr:anthrone oxygenase family protein [Acaryochloris marina]ABW31041.1 conserved hypothetical protein [Acaryochloris marina MBIC11017]BDM79761.1 membrane protein [Acaryochloris marina MBIC10699]